MRMIDLGIACSNCGIPFPPLRVSNAICFSGGRLDFDYTCPCGDKVHYTLAVKGVMENENTAALLLLNEINDA